MVASVPIMMGVVLAFMPAREALGVHHGGAGRDVRRLDVLTISLSLGAVS